MLLRIYQVSLFLVTMVVESRTRSLPVRHDTSTMQPNAFQHEEEYLFTTRREDGSPHVRRRLLSAIREKPAMVSEVKTKKVYFRNRISKHPTIQRQTHSTKTIGAALLKAAVHQSVSKPACGVPDPPKKLSAPRGHLLSRHRRYVLQGSKLPGTTITWNVPSNAWSTRLSDAVVNQTLGKAFRTWAEVIPLVFRWVDENLKPDITIKFAKGSHGDSSPFDGKGGELAHAYFPEYSGDIHFDDDEPWTADSPSTSLLHVAVHEIGHSLGLQHSGVSGSIMTPFYKDTSSTKLHADDKAGAQAIYGMCELPSIDGIESSMYDFKTYAFKDDLFWQFDDQSSSTVPGSPRKISSFWKGAPDKMDDILLWGWNWHIYFFKGSDYYRFDGGKVSQGYPRKISAGWRGIPDNIDAAFSTSSRVTYFLKGEFIYKFDNYYDELAPGYPDKIANVFPGVPNNVDTAFRWYYDGQVYFFKGKYFYKWSAADGVAKGPYNTELEWRSLCNV